MATEQMSTRSEEKWKTYEEMEDGYIRTHRRRFRRLDLG